MKYLRLLRTLASTMATSLCMLSAWGETQSANFDVRITLNTVRTQAICTHQLLSQLSNAIVKVVCSSGQFVSIEALPNRPFFGTQGGVHRYLFGPLSAIQRGPASESDPYAGTGTITSLQVINLHTLDTPLEIWVSF